MAQANNLLEEEDDIDENILLLNFYQANLQFLKLVPLHRIPDLLKFQAAALYYGTSQYENEWKGVLEDLGVDYITMHGIDYKSNKTGNLPIYLALNGILQSNRSFGDFIDVLCRREKFHILLHLKPFVEEILSTRHSYSGPEPSAPDLSSLKITSSLVDSFDSRDNCSAHQDTGYASTVCQERQRDDCKAAVEQFQNSEVISSFVNRNQLSVVSNSLGINRSAEEIISVFIMHSMLDKKYAKKLATRLKEKNFQVVTSANIYKFLRENPSRIMKAVDEKVDFVIPIVSESFMKQIKFTGSYATEEKDLESVANTFMYDRLLSEYCRSNFFNRRVKPVCYSLETRKFEKIDQILSWSAYLPFTNLKNDELLDSELIRHLRHS